MTNIFNEFIKGQQAAQNFQLNQMRLAQANALFPADQQIKQLEIERLQQERDAGTRKMQQEQTLVASRLAKQALSLTDPEIRNTFIQGAAQRLGISGQFDPQSVTDDDLMQLVAAGQSLATAKPIELQQAKQKELAGYTFNPATGQYSINPALKQQVEATKALAAKPDLKVSDISSINKDLTALTKDARGIKAAADSLISLKESSSPASKLAAVFKFMKALDPTSVVRETEQGQVYESQGIPELLLGKLNNITGEGKLTGQAFQDLVDTSKIMANSALETSREEAISFLDVFSELPDDRRAAFEKRVPTLFDVSNIKPIKPDQPATVTIGSGRNKRSALVDEVPVTELTDDQLMQEYERLRGGQ